MWARGEAKNIDGFFPENSVNFFEKPTFYFKIKKNEKIMEIFLKNSENSVNFFLVLPSRWYVPIVSFTIVMYRALLVLMNWLIDVNYANVGEEERGEHVSSQGMVQ